MSRTAKKPIPVFIHYGFDGGVSCSAIVAMDDEAQLAVGTAHGRCILLSPRTHLCVATVHVDPNERSIVAVGQFTESCIFVHVRAYAILLLSLDRTSKVLSFCITRTIPTEFYGFCGGFCHKSQLFCPFLEADKCVVGVFPGITEEMSRVWHPNENANAFMAFAVSDNGYLACGFETGRMKIVNIEDFSIIDEKKLFCKPILACASFANKVAVSSVKSPIILLTVEMNGIVDETEILFPQKAGGCCALSFSSCGKELASGYWDGTVRINSVKTGAIRVVLDFHSKIINCLCWNKIDGRRCEVIVDKCPERCLCHKGLVDCRRQSFLTVPRHLPVNTTVLDLRNNRLRKISKSEFTYLEKIEVLLVSWNQIHTIEKTLPKHFFDYSKGLKTLVLIDNPLNCDCRWTPLISFIHRRSDVSPLCGNPKRLYQQRFLSLEISDLQCFKMKLLDDNCSAKCEADNASVTFFYNKLRLPRQISNAPSAPNFTLKPQSRSYREGTSVRLDCEVTGRPRPSITWYFNDKKLRRSRKYEMNFEQTNLIIYPFLERDVGKYTCIAENPYGRIETSAEARLISSSPPVIIETPENHEVLPGSTVTFHCRADGEPRPFITWFFNGGEIPVLKGHFHVSDDEMKLTISGVTKRDEGVYSCMAGNTVGSMTAEARLVVYQNRIQENQLDDRLIQNIYQQASQNVDSAIEQTREKLSKLTTPHELLRWFQFSFPQTIELSRAREIYEESIRLIQKHVEKGLTLPLQELPSNISFESVLAKSHVNTLMQLAGCSGAQTRDPCDEQCFHSRYRTYDGQCNNQIYTMWGASQTHFRRLLLPVYENGFNMPVGWNPNKLYFGYPKPNARSVSRKLLGTHYITPHKTYSAMLMQWGQFIDHDMDFTATAISRHAFETGAICNRTCEHLNPCFNIPLTQDDPRMLINPRYPCIEFERSSAVCGSGETSLIYRYVTYREQMNTITSYIDGSGIYGSTEEDAYDLRDLNPDQGLLRYDIVSSTNKPYLPFERDSPVDCRRNWTLDHPVRCFLAGDFRANEQLGLMSMHTIFMREHNRLAAQIANLNPNLDGETIFQEARKIVGAELQHITFHDWLPKEQFDKLIGPYRKYQPLLDATISNSFATAAFRFGHTLVNPILYRLDENFEPIKDGHIPLRDAFFAPEVLLSTGSVDPYLRGLFATPMKKPMSEELLNIELTESLFNQAHEVALDLGAMNIQRGRDHALPGYVEFRKWCNLTPVENWNDLSNVMSREIIHKLKGLYGHPGNIDLFAGGIVEERINGSLVGPTFSCIIAEQFRRIRDGDRFWYEKVDVFNEVQREEIKKASLARIICDNADNITKVQDDVFLFVGKQPQLYRSCVDIPKLDLRPWQSCCYHLCPVRHNRYRRIQKLR
uniref:Ig-like domain-containing protein n=1 Tax=Setaria digitata TaxID=48799 RepID=A0A915PIU6_9BILA